MTRCAGWQGIGFACMVAGMQVLLDAVRSVCAVASMTLDPAPGGMVGAGPPVTFPAEGVVEPE
ncbi:hypothetical protein ACFWIJ_23435 [Streptomyces sp. NPDC127079]|uniref:hypothetical protein n=1 Tax=Streptomyces sp. NPDC127079 TaxID=3347132 RepID=UPI0036475B3E